MSAYEIGLEDGRQYGWNVGGRFRIAQNPYPSCTEDNEQWEIGFSKGFWGK